MRLWSGREGFHGNLQTRTLLVSLKVSLSPSMFNSYYFEHVNHVEFTFSFSWQSFAVATMSDYHTSTVMRYDNLFTITLVSQVVLSVVCQWVFIWPFIMFIRARVLQRGRGSLSECSGQEERRGLGSFHQSWTQGSRSRATQAPHGQPLHWGQIQSLWHVHLCCFYWKGTSPPLPTKSNNDTDTY